jgi:hypothetical protein
MLVGAVEHFDQIVEILCTSRLSVRRLNATSDFFKSQVQRQYSAQDPEGSLAVQTLSAIRPATPAAFAHRQRWIVGYSTESGLCPSFKVLHAGHGHRSV